MVRKLAVILLVIILMLVTSSAFSDALVPGEYLVGDDIASGWYSLSFGDGYISPVYLSDGCQVSLIDGMSLEPAVVTGFTVAPGIYSVPSDLPPGRYEISCADGFDWTCVDIWNAEGKLFMSGNLHVEEGGIIGLVVIEDGYRVKVQYGSARFAPSSGGITFE